MHNFLQQPQGKRREDRLQQNSIFYGEIMAVVLFFALSAAVATTNKQMEGSSAHFLGRGREEGAPKSRSSPSTLSCVLLPGNENPHVATAAAAAAAAAAETVTSPSREDLRFRDILPSPFPPLRRQSFFFSLVHILSVSSASAQEADVKN